MRLILYIFGFLFLLPNLSSAQTFKFKHFDKGEGLEQRFVYSVDQDEKGYILVGTGEGLYRYDGFKFDPLFVEEGLAENFITCSYKDDQGRIWLGHYGGNLSCYSQGKIQPFFLDSMTTSQINDIAQDRDGNIWAVAQNDGLIKIPNDGSAPELHNEQIEGFIYYDLLIDQSNRFYLGTDMGLVFLSVNDKEITDFQFSDDITETRVSTIQWGKDSTSVLVGTEDDGIFRMFLNEKRNKVFRVSANGVQLNRLSINDLTETPEGDLWVSTNANGLYRFSMPFGSHYGRVTDLNEGNQMGAPSIRKIFIDREQNIWIATKGNGLLKLADDYFSFFNITDGKELFSIRSIVPTVEGLWIGTNKCVYRTSTNPNQVYETYNGEMGLPEGIYSSIFIDPSDVVWAGSDGQGLFYLEPEKMKFRRFALAEDVLNMRVNDIIGVGNMIYVATDFGIYQIKDRKIVAHLTMQSGLPHNVIRSLYEDSQGRIWIGANNNEFTFIEDGIIQNRPYPIGANLMEVKCFAEDSEGNIWAGTEGAGLMMISDTSSVFFDKTSGLYSDYCYSVAADKNDRVWVGHRGALSCLNPEEKNIEIFDRDQIGDVDFQENCAISGPYDFVWFGTNKNLLRYDPDKDVRNAKEPILNLLSVSVGDSVKSPENISLPYGAYKIEFDFIGISHRKSDEVTYQHKLEGYDLDWSEPSTITQAKYSRLDPGNYVFHVRAFNSDGIGGSDEEHLELFIDSPFWMKWWFVVIIVVVVISAIRLFIYRRERIMRANQLYLQKELDARTKEVVDQKELLEVKNKDITDSIVYAKNIQKAMLPAPDALNQFFNESFVFFKPRDIVSGDFYWVEKFESKVLLACADCTGHGVPGAFMSMIGTVLLKDVSSSDDVMSPNEALMKLDHELKLMLNKEGSEFNIEDGMDISIVEFDMNTHILRAASARRPVIIYKDGERIEFKGDRFSIGGSEMGQDKDFTLFEMHLNPGDVFYQFSDGMPDQFGGEAGKKWKKKGVLDMLDNLIHLDMREQITTINKKFSHWKGELEQIDDVLLMGVRV